MNRILSAAYFFADELNGVDRVRLHTLLYLTQLVSHGVTGQFMFTQECAYSPGGVVFPVLMVKLKSLQSPYTAEAIRAMIQGTPFVDKPLKDMTHDELMDLHVLNDVLMAYGDRESDVLNIFLQSPATPSGRAYKNLFTDGRQAEPYPSITRDSMVKYAEDNRSWFSLHEAQILEEVRFAINKM